MIRHAIRAAVATLLVAFIPAVFAADPIVWKMGQFTPPGSSYLVAVNSIPERIAKATDGRLKVELHPSLVKAPEMPAAVRDGRLDSVAMIHAFMSGTAPTLSAGELPGMFWDIDDYKKALDAFLKEESRQVWAAQFNGVLLAQGAFDRIVIMSNKPLRKIEDFKGLKIRIPGAVAARLMVSLGARPVTVAFPEIAPALASGVVDAVMTDAGTSFGMGFYNIAKYLHVWRSGVVSWAVVANKDAWAKLPPDLQKAVADEFKAIERDHFAGYTQYSDAMIARMVEKGVTYIEPPKSEIDRMYSEKNTKTAYEWFYDLAKESKADGHRTVSELRKILGK